MRPPSNAYEQIVRDRNPTFDARIEPFSPPRFAGAFAAAGRTLGEREVALNEAEKRAILQAGLRVAPHWKLDDLGRAAMLVDAGEVVNPDELPGLVRELFLKGDNRERRAILQTLIVLPEPARFIDVALEGCRTNVRTVFEAIACENPYPEAWFEELNFNQMVLKALFMEVPLARIDGLAARITPELVRMARAYASERRAAGRTVPADIELVTSEGRS